MLIKKLVPDGNFGARRKMQFNKNWFRAVYCQKCNIIIVKCHVRQWGEFILSVKYQKLSKDFKKFH